MNIHKKLGRNQPTIILLPINCYQKYLGVGSKLEDRKKTTNCDQQTHKFCSSSIAFFGRRTFSRTLFRRIHWCRGWICVKIRHGLPVTSWKLRAQMETLWACQAEMYVSNCTSKVTTSKEGRFLKRIDVVSYCYTFSIRLTPFWIYQLGLWPHPNQYSIQAVQAEDDDPQLVMIFVSSEVSCTSWDW